MLASLPAHAQGEIDLSISVEALTGWNVEPGETVVLRVTLRNAGPDVAIEPNAYVSKQLGGNNNAYIPWPVAGAPHCSYATIIADGAPGYPSARILNVMFDDFAVGEEASCDVALHSGLATRGTSSLSIWAAPHPNQTEIDYADNRLERAVRFGEAVAVAGPAVVQATHPVSLVLLGVLGAVFGLRSLRRNA